MVGLLARCRISCQIAILVIAGLLGMAVVVAANIWALDRLAVADRELDRIDRANDLEGHLQVGILQMRRMEKNFILRHDEKSVAQFAKAQEDVSHTIDALAEVLTAMPSVRQTVLQTRDDMQQYEKLFAELVEARRKVGLTGDQGASGVLQRAVAAIDDKLDVKRAPEVQAAFLAMRQHEKDFMLRPDPAYRTAVDTAMAAFVAAAGASALPAIERIEVARQIGSYRGAFAQYVDSTLAAVAAERAIVALYAPIEPRIEAMDKAFVEQTRAVSAARDLTVERVHTVMWVCIAVGTAFTVLLGWIVGRGIARPVKAVTRAMEGLVAGDLDTAVPVDTRRDEIGTMIATLGHFRQSLIEAERLRSEQAALQQRGESDKRAAMIGMAERIEADAGQAVHRIGERAGAMMETAQQMRALATRTGEAATNAAGAASLALSNAQAVASASEELAASIREISGQVSQSAAVVNKAVAAGAETRETIETLNERVGRIGAMADIIGDIAAKTNLLALNATIEAARAGEAGKGFAVVASEVKQLASQTARSTEEISRHIDEVRAATLAATDSVARIDTTINEVNAIAGSIAAAVEEQGAATAEIARNVTETAAAVNRMSMLNGEVSAEASQAGQYAQDVAAHTEGLNDAVGELRTSIIRTVRTSTTEVDRRSSPRQPMDMPCRVEMAGHPAVNARISDLSEGGARLTGVPEVAAGARGTMRPGGERQALAFVVAGRDDDAVRVSFQIGDAERALVRGIIERQKGRAPDPVRTAA